MYDPAIESYSNAIQFCPTDSDAANDHMAVLHGNRAACYFSIKEYEVVVEDCTAALAINPSYVKVLNRRSQALELLDKPDEALAGD